MNHWNKIHIDTILLFFIMSILLYSMFVMWSASGQNINMIEGKIIQIIIGVLVMLIAAQIPPRVYETWAPHLYIVCVLLLVTVDIFGPISKGAKRWLDFGLVHFQPSEIVKVTVPLMVARCINRDSYPPSFQKVVSILILIIIPTFLVAVQPDLGTAILISIASIIMLFLSGISWKLIITAGLLALMIIPVLWFFCLQDYQQDRVRMLLDPTIDPLGAGYNIIQSKIAIGSGGFNGKGWLHGTQSQLNFLPERHTDFIFAVISEELGLCGVLVLLSLYLGVIIRGIIIAIKAQNTFSRLIAGELIIIFFCYMFVNIGMVSGILPVVGIPLPLISYGGSSLIMFMISFGIIMSIHTHRKILSTSL